MVAWHTRLCDHHTRYHKLHVYIEIKNIYIFVKIKIKEKYSVQWSVLRLLTVAIK